MADEQAPYEMFGHLKCWTFRELNFTNPGVRKSAEIKAKQEAWAKKYKEQHNA